MCRRPHHYEWRAVDHVDSIALVIRCIIAEDLNQGGLNACFKVGNPPGVILLRKLIDLESFEIGYSPLELRDSGSYLLRRKLRGGVEGLEELFSPLEAPDIEHLLNMKIDLQPKSLILLARPTGLELVLPP